MRSGQWTGWILHGTPASEGQVDQKWAGSINFILDPLACIFPLTITVHGVCESREMSRCRLISWTNFPFHLDWCDLEWLPTIQRSRYRQCGNCLHMYNAVHWCCTFMKRMLLTDIVQNCINQFTTLAKSGQCRFIGNVGLGRDVNLAQLRPYYHAIVMVSVLTASLCVAVQLRCVRFHWRDMEQKMTDC